MLASPGTQPASQASHPAQPARARRESTPAATPASRPPGPAAAPAGPVTAVGTVESYGYGELAARVSISGGRITGITVPVLRTAEQYSQQLAVQVIPTCAARCWPPRAPASTRCPALTYTSQAYAVSVQAGAGQGALPVRAGPPRCAPAAGLAAGAGWGARPGPAPANPRGARDGHGRVLRRTPAAPARGGQHERRPDPATAIEAACALLHEADAVFSTWDPQSPLSRLRRGDLAEPDGPACLAEVRDGLRGGREVSGGWSTRGHARRLRPDRAGEGLGRGPGAGRHPPGGPARALVNGGGDLAAYGGPAAGEPWRAGIRHPWRRDALAAVLEVARRGRDLGGLRARRAPG